MERCARVVILAGIAAGLLQVIPGEARAQVLEEQVLDDRIPDIILFTHITCRYCDNAKAYLADLERRDQDLRIWIRELTEDPRAASDLEELARMAGAPWPVYPAWVIGGRVFMVGFGSAATTGRQIEQILSRLALPPPAAPATEAEDPAPPPPTPAPAPREPAPTPSPVPAEARPVDLAAVEDEATEPVVAEDEAVKELATEEHSGLRVAPAEATSLSLPFFGDVDAASMSLPALTGLIAFVDGFNPCSLWVLTFLLGIVIYSGSRRRVLLVGGVFLLVTASAYGLFIVGMFGTLRYLAYLSWITLVVAGMALVFGLVNIKDYFWFQKGASFTISDKHKPKLFERARNLMHPGRSLPALLVGTVVLALGITLVELPCTAGFPMVWTGIIATQSVPLAYFSMLLILYLAIYLMIELVIFGSFVITMKRSRFEEKHGRILKLFGGMIMLALALTLIVAPDTMHSLGGTLAVFGGALTVSVAVLLLHRRVLPRYGIVIGSEDLGVGRRGRVTRGSRR